MGCEEMENKHEVKLAVVETKMETMQRDINSLKDSQRDHGEKLEKLDGKISDLSATIKSWGAGAVVAISLLELFLKFYLR